MSCSSTLVPQLQNAFHQCTLQIVDVYKWYVKMTNTFVINSLYTVLQSSASDAIWIKTLYCSILDVQALWETTLKLLVEMYLLRSLHCNLVIHMHACS